MSKTNVEDSKKNGLENSGTTSKQASSSPSPSTTSKEASSLHKDFLPQIPEGVKNKYVSNQIVISGHRAVEESIKNELNSIIIKKDGLPEAWKMVKDAFIDIAMDHRGYGGSYSDGISDFKEKLKENGISDSDIKNIINSTEQKKGNLR